MKLKEEMYVRTKRGQIGKITTIGKYNIAVEFNGMWQDIVSKTNIAKEPSFNIIDLIENGDYVNGYKVDFVQNNEIIFNHNHPTKLNIFAKDIKSIVTKEQFDNIAYKIRQ